MRARENRGSKRMDLTDTWNKYRLWSLYQNSNCFPQSWPRFASAIILSLNHAFLAQLFTALWILALGLSSSWACLSGCLICPLCSRKPFWVLCWKNQFVIQKLCNLDQHCGRLASSGPLGIWIQSFPMPGLRSYFLLQTNSYGICVLKKSVYLPLWV